MPLLETLSVKWRGSVNDEKYAKQALLWLIQQNLSCVCYFYREQGKLEYKYNDGSCWCKVSKEKDKSGVRKKTTNMGQKGWQGQLNTKVVLDSILKEAETIKTKSPGSQSV